MDDDYTREDLLMARHASDLSAPYRPSDVFVDIDLGVIYRISGETLHVIPDVLIEHERVY